MSCVTAWSAVALTRYDQVAVDDLPDKVMAYVAQYVLVVERRYILRVLRGSGWQ